MGWRSSAFSNLPACVVAWLLLCRAHGVAELHIALLFSVTSTKLSNFSWELNNFDFRRPPAVSTPMCSAFGLSLQRLLSDSTRAALRGSVRVRRVLEALQKEAKERSRNPRGRAGYCSDELKVRWARHQLYRRAFTQKSFS